MTLLKSTYSSMTLRTHHLKFWNNIVKIELTGFCENLNKLIEEILIYSMNFTNEDFFYLSETIFGLSMEEIELLNNTMAQIKVKQVKSSIKRINNQKLVLASLGLRGIGKEVTPEATPSILGMIEKVKHLVTVTEV